MGRVRRAALARSSPRRCPSGEPARLSWRRGRSRKPALPRRRLWPRPARGAPRLDGPAVLIVEDETALAAAMAESFGDAGFLVDRAGDGEEALARLEGGHYDVIISDLKMPRMDGIQLFAALRERHPGDGRAHPVRDRRRGRHRRRAVPRRERLPLARQAVQAQRTAPPRARSDGVPPGFTTPGARRSPARSASAPASWPGHFEIDDAARQLAVDAANQIHELDASRLDGAAHAGKLHVYRVEALVDLREARVDVREARVDVREALIDLLERCLRVDRERGSPS